VVIGYWLLKFTYNLKGQSPEHTRRGFKGFCYENIREIRVIRGQK
jgi:hypothetical protein